LEYLVKHYSLEQGALEIQYMEEFFGEFPRKKTADEIARRLEGREHLILMAMAPLPDDPTQMIPVSYKVCHELRRNEAVPKLADLVDRLHGCVQFAGRRVIYHWIGGTRNDWRGKGFFHALTEQQETWALEHGYHEMVVKTKNMYYQMRGSLDHMHFNVIKLERNSFDESESKVYLSKKLLPETLQRHKFTRTVMAAA
jgi:hypothetical protein